MAWCPFAVRRTLPENYYQPRIDPSQAIIHSAVDARGPSTLYNFFVRGDVGVEAHFFVKLDGVIEQYMDTNVRADANRYANPLAVSIETEDDGNPDQRPWTLAQIVSIRRLLEWLFRVHPKIKRRVCPAWNAAGVGWHSMWGAPSPWTPAVGKTCPGVARKAQIPREIVRWLSSGAPAPKAPQKPQESDPLAGITLEQIGLKTIEAVRWCVGKDAETRKALVALLPSLDHIGLKVIESVRWCVSADEETREDIKDLVREVLEEA